MCTYTIIATITKVEGKKLYFKGVGEHFKKVNSYLRNVLSSDENLKEIRLEESFFELNDVCYGTSDAFYRELFLRSMLDKKPLKFEFNFKDGKGLEIKSISRIDE